MSSDFALIPAAFYDDMESDRGWKLQISKDDAVTGRWIRDVPMGTGSPSFFQPQPGMDHPPGAGTQCFVTGNFPDPFNPFAGSVTEGKTTLTSPSLSIGGIVDPRIGFWRWYTNEWPAIFFAIDGVFGGQRQRPSVPVALGSAGGLLEWRQGNGARAGMTWRSEQIIRSW